ncbi:hypothetical protein DY023_10995 [Microbacterium bovistercoris]|uniref:Uncharacterized protein n=1 Tax=Microbacterium bovistercoris TaxID=2293570 RepID=A0A371NTY3_9MICO|nr:hypothetical protein [Microbacterium bovistercoris]REJ05103.1 hypothetical protein DY023_10995 [Microbacterium bovistercoris]
MTNNTTRTTPALPWMLILGLASLSLLWPLTTLLGVGNGAPRALMILGVTAAVWVGMVGFGRVRRPVLTLTITGLVYGFIALVLAGITPGGGGPFGDTASLWGLIPGLIMNAGVGALVGLLALAVQKMIGPRKEA